MLNIDIVGGKILITTDDPSVHFFLEGEVDEGKFDWIIKRWRPAIVKKPIFKNKTRRSGIFKYELGLGWAAYLMTTFAAYITQDEYERLRNAIVADSYRDIPFPGLRDYQNEDVLFLLKYRIGLFSTNTSYGKTQTISTLVDYARGLGKRVLLVTPGNKARDELIKRCKSVFGIEVSTNLGDDVCCLITSGFSKRKEFKDPKERANLGALLSTYDWVMVDEVEYTINPSGEFIYDNCSKATNFYGFSGTSDKVGGQAITFRNGLDSVVMRNRKLINYFGPTLIYRMPLNIDVETINVVTPSLNNIKFKAADMSNDGNLYQKVMNKIWTNDEICKDIIKIAKKYPRLFIPMNNLVDIIYNWIENYFKGVFRVLLICSKGYVYYDLEGNETILDLNQACEYINNGLVDIIPSTSSGYRALDLPGLQNIALFAGKVAGVVLQCVGRVARGTQMHIISLSPLYPAKIPIYSKGAQERKEMIEGFYKYCNVKEITVSIDNL